MRMDWKNPLHLLAALAVVAVVIVGLYYVISPYQNCMRTFPDGTIAAVNDASCQRYSSW